MQFSESICIIDVDVNHYKIILYYLLWVLSIAQINSTEVFILLINFYSTSDIICDYVPGYYIRVLLLWSLR